MDSQKLTFIALCIFVWFGSELCNAKAVVQLDQNQGSENGIMCYGCQTAIGLLKIRLNDSVTQKLIEKKLTKDCMILTGNKTDTCTFLVPLAMELMRTALTTLTDLQICQDIGLCTESVFITKKWLDNKNTDSNGIKCSLCKLVVRTADDYLLKMVGSVSDYVEQFCKNLPQPASKECMQWVKSMDFNKTLPLVIKVVLDPEDVCEMAGLCTPPSVGQFKDWMRDVDYSSPVAVVANNVRVKSINSGKSVANWLTRLNKLSDKHGLH